MPGEEGAATAMPDGVKYSEGTSSAGTSSIPVVIPSAVSLYEARPVPCESIYMSAKSLSIETARTVVRFVIISGRASAKEPPPARCHRERA